MTTPITIAMIVMAVGFVMFAGGALFLIYKAIEASHG